MLQGIDFMVFRDQLKNNKIFAGLGGGLSRYATGVSVNQGSLKKPLVKVRVQGILFILLCIPNATGLFAIV